MNRKLCVSTPSISMTGEEGASDMTPPAVGDMVTFEGEARVAEVRDGVTYLEVQTVNGEPLPDESGMQQELGEEEMLAAEGEELKAMSDEGGDY